MLTTFILDQGCWGQGVRKPRIIIKIPLDLRFFWFASPSVFFHFLLSQTEHWILPQGRSLFLSYTSLPINSFSK